MVIKFSAIPEDYEEPGSAGEVGVEVHSIITQAFRG